MSDPDPLTAADQPETGLLAALAAPPGPAAVEARRVGDAMRRVIERLAAGGTRPEQLAGAAERLEALAAALEHSAAGPVDAGGADRDGAAGARAFVEWSPLLGRANPMAPPIVAEVVEGRIVGRVRFGAAYEGPPGCVHGGCIAAGFDEILGLANSLSGAAAMTGSLTVRYRRPTPLHAELTYVGRLIGVSGRRVKTHGELWLGQVLTAEADGLFVRVGRGRLLELMEARRDQTGSTGPAPLDRPV